MIINKILFGLIDDEVSNHQTDSKDKKELESSELVIATNKTLTGVRSYYLVHSSQENSMLIEKFVDWIQLELKNEALPCSFGTIE